MFDSKSEDRVNDGHRGRSLRRRTSIMIAHDTNMPFRKGLKEYIASSSLEGIENVLDSEAHIARKIFWGLLVCFALGFMIFQVVDRGTYYGTYPSYVHVQEYYPFSVPFPVVTICSENVWRKSVLQNLGQNAVFLADQIYSPLRIFDSVEKRKPNLTGVDFGQYDWMRFYENAAHQRDKLIYLCLWEDEDCITQNFTVTNTDMGVCYTFNVEQTLKSTKPGVRYGLQLLINVEQDEYIAMQDFSVSAGIRVLLHEKTDIPRMSLQGIRVSVGEQTNIDIRTQKVTNQVHPWGICQPDQTLQRYPAYTHSGCLAECEAQYMLKQCNCRLIFYPGNETVCSPQDTLLCVIAAKENFSAENDFCNCSKPCTDTIYTPEISSSRFAKYFLKSMSAFSGISEQNLTDNFLKLDIYYGQISFLGLYEERNYSILALLCDVGGAMGLLLGSTVFTFIAIIDFLIVSLFSTRKDKAKVDNSQQNGGQVTKV